MYIIYIKPYNFKLYKLCRWFISFLKKPKNQQKINSPINIIN